MKKAILAVFLLAAVRPAMATEAVQTGGESGVGIYKAGEITVSGKKSGSAETVSAAEMEKLGKQTLSEAAGTLPGINISNVGGRNEGMIYVRGFDMRQVPLYLDGVPLYVPYDGYVDPNRFLTMSLSGISVSKGFTSVLYGPNTLGGAINMVSRKPEKRLEGNVTAGGSFGDDQIDAGFGSFNIASNQGKWYVQAGLSLLDRDFRPLSGSFDPMKYENGGKQDNSDTRDISGTVKVGYTPNSTDEYAITFNSQHSEKGVPVYTGSNPTQPIRYWRYGNWDKTSIYYIGKTSLGETSYLKTRAYFDNYYNTLESYDDATYTTQKTSKAFSSRYDDHTVGGSVEFGTSIIKDNMLKLALLDKYDMHNEIGNIGEQSLDFEDNTFSVAAENTWSASSHVSVIAGVRQDFRSTIRAEEFADKTKSSIRSFSLEDNQATNAQLAVVGKIDEHHELTGYIASTTRFPTLKDRYSYKLGKAIANPDLDPEQSLNYGLDYTFRPSGQVTMRASVYQSKLEDTIQQVNNVAYDAATRTWLYQMQNTGKSTFSGFEYSADWQPLEWLKAHVSYSCIDRHNNSNPDLMFTDVPRHRLNGYLQFLVDRSTWVLIESEYNTRRYSTSDGLYTAGAYGLVNLRMNVGLNDALTLHASVDNLFDRNYEVAEGYPEPGREYTLSMTCAF
ncbi:MAG: TonB-dependent receptor [Chlorobiaceae bacterium]|nr:TonB-dependent receptor [Chlorobiaceae bacterium]